MSAERVTLAKADPPWGWSQSLFGFYAETGTSGEATGSNALFFDYPRACEYVRAHGGYVVALYRGPPPLASADYAIAAGDPS